MASLTYRLLLTKAPRAHLFRSTPCMINSASMSTTTPFHSDNVPPPPSSFPFRTGPSPPRLPKEEQEIYEQLQRESTGAFSTPKINQSPHSIADADADASSSSTTATLENALSSTKTSSTSSTLDTDAAELKRRFEAAGDGEELHPNLRRGAMPEFEGEKNPKTGEVGGPKNEPLRWGGEGDWSYNGRVTDF